MSDDRCLECSHPESVHMKMQGCVFQVGGHSCRCAKLFPERPYALPLAAPQPEWDCVKCAVCAARCAHTKVVPGCKWSCPDHDPEHPSKTRPTWRGCGVCGEARTCPACRLAGMAPALKDSGERVASSTGAVRDSATGRGRYDLVSPIMMERLAKHLEAGAAKYGARNWEKGLPIARMFASLFRHSWQAFLQQTDEDHLAAVICNAMFIMHTLEMIKRGRLPYDLNDLPSYMPTIPQEIEKP